MNKAKLTSGVNCFSVKIEHLVTADVFASALACHYYESSEEFNTKLNKKEARLILYTQLRFGGDNSNYDRDGVFEGATDSNDIYDPIYKAAMLWVVKNYPYLTPTL